MTSASKGNDELDIQEMILWEKEQAKNKMNDRANVMDPPQKISVVRT